MDTLSVRPRSASGGGGTRHTPAYPGQLSLFDQPGETQPSEVHDGAAQYGNNGQTGSVSDVHEIPSGNNAGTNNPAGSTTQQAASQRSKQTQNTQSTGTAPAAGVAQTAPAGNSTQTEPEYVQETFIDPLDREGVVKAINDSGLLSYDVRNVRISNHLNSLYSLARLLRQSGKYQDATDDVLEEIVKMIRE